MTLIYVVGESNHLYTVSDIMLSGAPKDSEIDNSPIPFRAFNKDIPSGTSMFPKTFRFQRNFFLWSGRKLYRNILEQRLISKFINKNISDVIGELFSDPRVSDEFELIWIDFSHHGLASVRAYGCFPVHYEKYPGAMSFAGGSGQGDQLYEIEGISGDSLGKDISFHLAMRTMIQALIREQSEEGFYEKNYGFGYRMHGIDMGRLRLINYEIDFFRFSEKLRAFNYLGRISCFGKGRREFFSAMSIEAGGNISAKYFNVSEGAANWLSMPPMKIFEMERSVKFDFSLAWVYGRNRSIFSVPRNLVRLGTIRNGGPVFKLRSDAHHILRAGVTD